MSNHSRDHVPKGLYYFIAISTVVNLAAIGTFLHRESKSRERSIMRKLVPEFNTNYAKLDGDSPSREYTNAERYNAFVRGETPKIPLYNTTEDLRNLVKKGKEIRRAIEHGR
jgi:hypothetical protein